MNRQTERFRAASRVLAGYYSTDAYITPNNTPPEAWALRHAVYFAPEWERSPGARLEYVWAEELGLPAFVSLDDLVVWTKERAA